MGELAEAIHRLNEALRALGHSAPRDITMRTHEEWLQLAGQLRAHLTEQGIPPLSDAPISAEDYEINICGTSVRSPGDPGHPAVTPPIPAPALADTLIF